MKTQRLSLSSVNAGIWASERPRSDADLVIFSLMNRSLMCAVIRPAPPLNHLIDCWFIVVHKWVTADDDHHLDKPSIPSSIAPYVLDEILTLIGCWAGFELCSHGVFRALTEEESQCLKVPGLGSISRANKFSEERRQAEEKLDLLFGDETWL